MGGSGSGGGVVSRKRSRGAAAAMPPPPPPALESLAAGAWESDASAEADVMIFADAINRMQVCWMGGCMVMCILWQHDHNTKCIHVLRIHHTILLYKHTQQHVGAAAMV